MIQLEQKEEQSWRLARELVWEVYGLSSRGHFARDFRIQNSLRRASSAILANVADAVEREGSLASLRYLEQSQQEIGELSRQLLKARQHAYISEAIQAHIDELLSELSVSIRSLEVAESMAYAPTTSLMRMSY